MLCLREASGELQKIVTEFAGWLANEQPPWAAYHALMDGRLIYLDKHPGVWPMEVEETWRRMMAKCVIKVAGQEAKEACGTEQPYRGWGR